MAEQFYTDIESYLSSCGICQADGEIGSFSEIRETKSILEYFERLVSFHNRTFGYTGFLAARPNNCTGKKVEEYKLKRRWLKKEIEKIKKMGCNDLFQMKVLEKGEQVIESCDISLKRIYENGYYALLKRSMNKMEICTGGSYIFKDELLKKIYVTKLKKCCYNMIEFDCLTLLKKLKYKSIKLNWEEVTNEYCRMEGLDRNSAIFILEMQAFPIEFIKCVEKYNKCDLAQTRKKFIYELDRIIEIEKR